MSGQQDGGELKRFESYQYPSGHVGHLTQTQRDTLERFKALCQSKKYYTPATESAPASHDDETLLRYLRARKFSPEEAFGQLKDTEDWRAENQLDELYNTIDIEEYEQTRRLYPQWLGRRDKRGIPVYLFEVAHLDNKAVSAYANSTEKKGQSTSSSKVPTKMLRLFALYENLCRFVLPLCSTMPDRPYPETPISQSSNIVDISNVGLRQFWNLKNHMQDASVLATAHYPETLDRIFLIGAPSFFPTVWSWVKRWFDPITVSKIFILSAAEVKPTLLQYIDEENIPKKYGGKLDFKFGDMPLLEPAMADTMDWKDSTRKGGFRSFPTGPIKWDRGADGTMHAVAVGTENGVKRSVPIAGVHPADSAAQSALKPGRSSKADLIRTTTGEATHPPTPPAGAADVKPADMADADANEGKTEGAEVPDTSRAGTYTVPFRDAAGERTEPPEVRQGTSDTRFEQQSSTHAADKLAEGTPEVRHMGHGDKVNVMEPGTIGQAPKEHPVPKVEEQPSVIDQAKDMAGQAYTQAANLPHTVAAAVGMGGQQPKEEPKEPVKKEDPAVDGMDARKVEEFLRAQNMSKPQPPGNQG